MDSEFLKLNLRTSYEIIETTTTCKSLVIVVITMFKFGMNGRVRRLIKTIKNKKDVPHLTCSFG